MTGGNWYSLHQTAPQPMNMVKGVSLAFVQWKGSTRAPAWPAHASKPIISKHLDRRFCEAAHLLDQSGQE